MQTARVQMGWPRPGRALIGILVTLVVAYVLELVALRADWSFVGHLTLTPKDVFEGGALWQLVTYNFLHAPEQPGHLFGNLLWLYFFGTKMEQHWGGRGLLWRALVFGVAGGVLTLLVGLLTKIDFIGGLLPGFWERPHLGASGAAMGVVIAYGLTFANEQLQLLLLGAVTGKTLVIGVVVIELIRALSFDPVSSTAHFGGMIAALIMVKGGSTWRKTRLEVKKKKLEHDLQVIQGGRAPANLPKNPKEWN